MCQAQSNLKTFLFLWAGKLEKPEEEEGVRNSRWKSTDSFVLECGEVLKHLLFLDLREAFGILQAFKDDSYIHTNNDPEWENVALVLFLQEADSQSDQRGGFGGFFGGGGGFLKNFY